MKHWELVPTKDARVDRPRFFIRKKGRTVGTLKVRFASDGAIESADLKANMSSNCDMTMKGFETRVRELWLKHGQDVMNDLIPIEELPPVDVSEEMKAWLPTWATSREGDVYEGKDGKRYKVVGPNLAEEVQDDEAPIPRHVANFYQEGGDQVDDDQEEEPGEDYLVGQDDQAEVDPDAPPPNHPERMDLPELVLTEREKSALKFAWDQGGECHVRAFQIKNYGINLLARLAGAGYFDMLDDPPRLKLTLRGTKAVAAATPLEVDA